MCSLSSITYILSIPVAYLHFHSHNVHSCCLHVTRKISSGAYQGVEGKSINMVLEKHIHKLFKLLFH